MADIKKTRFILWEALHSVLFYLSAAEKRRAIGMFLLLIVSSILDVVGLASLVPIIMAASRTGYVFQNKYLFKVYSALEFISESKFYVFIVVLLLIFFVLKNIFTTLINYKQERFIAEISLAVVDSQFAKYNKLPFWHFSQLGSARLIYLTFNTANNFTINILRQLFIFFSEIVIVAVIVLGILLYRPVLFIILAVVLLPTVLLIYRFLNKRAASVGVKLNELRPFSYVRILDAFNGFIELRLANKQDYFKNRVLKLEKTIQQLDAQTFLYAQLPIKVIELMAIVAVVTIFMYSLFLSDNPSELVTIIGLFAAAAYRLMPSVNRIVNSMVAIRGHRHLFDELQRFRAEADVDNNIGYQPLSFKEHITFNNLIFTFPETSKPTLNKISLVVKKGEKIGIIGASGSGKTTLMNVLLRFYIEQQGSISVDGQPLTEANKYTWYKLIGYVKQDTFLMQSTIQDNITLADEVIDSERMQYAIEQASLSSFIASLPEGLDTKVGERGARLSGGQRQRIGIARALYKNNQVLILDEATSALDNETEREVNEAIRRLASTDITIFIVAHRITTLQDCDRIIELRDGQIYAEHQYVDLINQIKITQQHDAS